MKKSFNVDSTFNDMRIDRWIRNNLGNYPQGLIEKKFKDRFIFKGYESGHMMYLRREDLKKSNQDLRDFILNTVTNNKSAKY